MRRFLLRLLKTCREVFRRPFDYRAAYRKTDLERDWWTIVGPATREEFEELGHSKRQLLIEHGLTPQGRVLDVGCGTGQLTQALTGYLDASGLYHGTDIAPEAVAFCRRKFGRGNFHFVPNEMTRIPLEGIDFDFIYLGSVFTHIYPAEINALLLDLKRLLAPQGQMFADVFVAPLGSLYDGNRGMVVVNASDVEQLFASTGLAFGELRELEGKGPTRRLLYKFTHPQPSQLIA